MSIIKKELITLALIWLAISGFLTGTMLLVFRQTYFAIQLLFGSTVSGLLVIGWFKVIKPCGTNKTTAGMAKASILNTRGKIVKFPDKASKVIVHGVSGNTFIVNKV